MKKLILLATVAIAALIYQPAKAQVSLNVNIGAQPYYYAPAPAYVYVSQPRYVRPAYVYPTRTVVVTQPRYYARPRVYRSNHNVYHVKKFKGGKHRGHGRR